MVDKKMKFVLSLQGKEYAGHLDYWSTNCGDLAGLKNGKYQLTARCTEYEIIDNEYATSKHAYVTLGEKCEHLDLIERIQ